MAAFGAPPELVEDLRPKDQRAAVFEVHEDNWPVVEVFIAMETQWRLDEGRPLGMDYTALPVVCGFLRRAKTPELFAGLRIMEGAALTALAELRSKR